VKIVSFFLSSFISIFLLLLWPFRTPLGAFRTPLALAGALGSPRPSWATESSRAPELSRAPRQAFLGPREAFPGPPGPQNKVPGRTPSLRLVAISKRSELGGSN
jgi:hypothetical protein